MKKIHLSNVSYFAVAGGATFVALPRLNFSVDIGDKVVFYFGFASSAWRRFPPVHAVVFSKTTVDDDRKPAVQLFIHFDTLKPP